MSELYTSERGEGQPLVLLHSGGMNHSEWQPQMDRLSKRLHVIAPDMLGHGRSPAPDGPLRVRALAESVLRTLDARGIERAHWAGSSLGGATALWAAVHHPERVDKLVLYRVGYRKTADSHGETRRMADAAYWERMGMAGWLAKIHEPQGGPEAWKTVIGRVSQALDPADSDHNHDLASLGGIRGPTLLIVGDRDPVAPLDDVLSMYRNLPDARLWVIPGASHVTASNTWRAEAFGVELERFFTRATVS